MNMSIRPLVHLIGRQSTFQRIRNHFRSFSTLFYPHSLNFLQASARQDTLCCYMVQANDFQILMAGILAAIWTQQQNSSPASAMFGDVRYQIISSALKQWKTSWSSDNTVREPASRAGFFQEGNFKWWVVANCLLSRKIPVPGSGEGEEVERVAMVFKVLKACHLLQMRGIQESTASLEDVLETLPGDLIINDGLDTLTKEFMITETVV